MKSSEMVHVHGMGVEVLVYERKVKREGKKDLGLCNKRRRELEIGEKS